MVGIIVLTDILFFRYHLGLRLAFNVGVVLVFASIYLRFLNN